MTLALTTIASTPAAGFWSAGSLPLALGAGLAGAGLLVSLRLLRGWGRFGRKRTQGVPPTGDAETAVATAPLRARAKAAYAGAMGNRGSSPGIELPIAETPAGSPASDESREPGTPCPAALSRRIDRLEARVRARRAGSRG